MKRAIKAIAFTQVNNFLANRSVAEIHEVNRACEIREANSIPLVSVSK